jgi:magnesium-transporting ATPase (P-type)
LLVLIFVNGGTIWLVFAQQSIYAVSHATPRHARPFSRRSKTHIIGRWIECFARHHVVRGVLLVLHEGDVVIANAVLLQGQISEDESLLTGGAVPQDKIVGKLDSAMGLPGYAENAFVFAITVVTRGVEVACVRATASHTAVGRIGAAFIATTPVASRC